MESWLNWLNATDIEYTKEQYSPVDCIFNFKNSKVVAEIKVRDIKFRELDTHYMELNKFNNMVKYISDNDGDLGLYVNFFGDNWCYTYQLQNIKPETTNTYEIKWTTSGNQIPVPKEIIEIPVDKANIYYRENIKSKWRKVK